MPSAPMLELVKAMVPKGEYTEDGQFYSQLDLSASVDYFKNMDPKLFKAKELFDFWSVYEENGVQLGVVGALVDELLELSPEVKAEAKDYCESTDVDEFCETFYYKFVDPEEWMEEEEEEEEEEEMDFD